MSISIRSPSPPLPNPEFPRSPKIEPGEKGPITVGQFPILACPASHLALSSASSLFPLPLSTRYTHASRLARPSLSLSLCDQRQRQLWVFATSIIALERKSHHRSHAYNGTSSCPGPLPRLLVLAMLGARNTKTAWLEPSPTPSGIIVIILSSFQQPPLLIILSLGLPLPRV